MTTHHDQLILPYTPAQLFALVADIARYPEFLPWCRAARILERKEGELLAELMISFKGFSESYVSRVRLEPPGEGGQGNIDVEMVEGPFHHLTNRWYFHPAPDGACSVDFHLDFQFRSRLLEAMIGGLFDRAADRMVEAFTKRAAEIYGGGGR